MISYQNPGSNAFSRLKMQKNNLIADNFLIQFFAHVTLKYSAYTKESTLTVYKGNVCKKWRKKIEVRSGERLHLQWHKDTFSQAHDSADSKLKVYPELAALEHLENSPLRKHTHMIYSNFFRSKIDKKKLIFFLFLLKI